MHLKLLKQISYWFNDLKKKEREQMLIVILLNINCNRFDKHKWSLFFYGLSITYILILNANNFRERLLIFLMSKLAIINLFLNKIKIKISTVSCLFLNLKFHFSFLFFYHCFIKKILLNYLVRCFRL